MAERTLQKLVDFELLLLDLLMQLGDRLRLFDNRVVLLAELLFLLDDEGLAGDKIVGWELRLVHARKYSESGP